MSEKAYLLETGEEVEIAHVVYIRHGRQFQGTQGLLDGIDQLVEAVEDTKSLLRAYILHVGQMEGIDFIDGCDHCHDRVTDDQWEKLKEIAQLAGPQ